MPNKTPSPIRKISMLGDSLVVELNTPDAKPAAHAFEERHEVTACPADSFHGCFNAAGVLERVVTTNAADRKVLGALVGGWVAEGFRVQTLSRKEAIKHLRAGLPAAPKQDQAPASPDGGPGAGTSAGSGGGQPAGQQGDSSGVAAAG